MKCNYDCLNCKYEDCVEDEISDSEISEIEGRDHSLENEIKLSEWMGITGEKARHMRYRYRNEERYKEKTRKASKKWADKNKDYRRKYDKSEKRKSYLSEYYQKNKERLLQKSRENYQKRKNRLSGCNTLATSLKETS